MKMHGPIVLDDKDSFGVRVLGLHRGVVTNQGSAIKVCALPTEQLPGLIVQASGNALGVVPPITLLRIGFLAPAQGIAGCEGGAAIIRQFILIEQNTALRVGGGHKLSGLENRQFLVVQRIR